MRSLQHYCDHEKPETDHEAPETDPEATIKKAISVPKESEVICSSMSRFYQQQNVLSWRSCILCCVLLFNELCDFLSLI